MKPNSAILFILSIMCLSGCYAYPSYKDRYGHTLKPAHPKDYSKWYFSNPKQTAPQPFDISRFGAEVALENGDQPVEYVTADDVNRLKETVPQLLLFVWNPDCPSGNELTEYADKFDALGIPVILVSLTYDVPMIQSKLKNTGFNKRAIYIIPSVGYYPNNIVDKEIAFLKILCNSCYRDYRDELLSAQGLLFQKDTTVLLYNMQYEDMERLF